jgi:hypothetical protein
VIAALEVLAASNGRTRAAFCGGADPGWLSAIDRGELRPEPSVRLPEFAPPSPEQRILDYLDEALKRCEAWAHWHARRAKRRGLHSSADCLSRAAGIMASLQERPGLSWLADATRRAAVGVVEREFASFGFHVYVRDHLREFETSHLRTLASVTIPQIHDLQRQLSEGYLTDTEAQLAAAEELAFAPGYPPQEAEIEN